MHVLRRSINLLRDADEAQVKKCSEHPRLRRIFVEAQKAGARGWYRLKVISPVSPIQRVSIEALDETDARIFAHQSFPSGSRFTAYAFLGSRVAYLRIELDLDAASESKSIATLRPISIIEYVWRSIRRGFARGPRIFLRYFFRPLDQFIITFGFPQPPEALYMWWIAKRERPAYKRLMNAVSVQTVERPSIAILMTVRDPQPAYLRKAIASVRHQTTDNWQLCIADDASGNGEVIQTLSDAARSDPRIRVSSREQRGGDSAAANTAFDTASSPFVACLDHEDELAPTAVATVASYLSQEARTSLVYSDNDMLDQRGTRFDPFFKPDFSPDLLRSYNYIGRLTAYHSDTIRQIGGWRSELDGAQDYDLNLRAVEVSCESQIRHIPMILYHRRAIRGSAAQYREFNACAVSAGRQAVIEHLARRSIVAQVDIVADTMYRVRYELPDPQPMVSIIIPFRNKADLLRQCVSSIEGKTTYKNYEIVLVDNGSVEPSTLALLRAYGKHERIRVLEQPGVFNYSALNNRAVELTRGDYLCLLNNDTVVRTPDWLEDMVGYASQPGVGCVGAKLFYANGTVQHAGVVLGLGGAAGHVFRRRTRDDPGYFGRLLVASNFSAVTGACLVVRRVIYMEVGGLDEREFPISLNDIDFCIKLRLRGYRNVMTPFAELFHYESSSRGQDDLLRIKKNVNAMQARYGALLDSDPCYSPHLALTDDGFSLRVD